MRTPQNPSELNALFQTKTAVFVVFSVSFSAENASLRGIHFSSTRLIRLIYGFSVKILLWRVIFPCHFSNRCIGPGAHIFPKCRIKSTLQTESLQTKCRSGRDKLLFYRPDFLCRQQVFYYRCTNSWVIIPVYQSVLHHNLIKLSKNDSIRKILDSTLSIAN